MSNDMTKLVIISGPAGAGKSTVVRQLLQRCPLPLELSVSAATRPPRSGEQDGVHYHFMTDEQFQRRREVGEFLECFEVFNTGHWYGTPRDAVTAGLNAGKWVILEIDVNGALAVLEHFPDAVTIFIRPATVEELERRLRDRGTESEESITRRLEVAHRELAQAHLYRYQVINDTVQQAADDICEILTSQGESEND